MENIHIVIFDDRKYQKSIINYMKESSEWKKWKKLSKVCFLIPKASLFVCASLIGIEKPVQICETNENSR